MSKIKIGLFGFGVVGQGIYQVVQKSKNAHAEIVKICVRDPEKPRKVEVDKSLFTTSADEILDNRDINLIVEVIDQADAAYSIVKRALLRGIPVVSGNKTMLAHHLPELIEIQKTHNVALLYDASSCGSIPVIRNLEEYYDNDLLLEVKGILNGSSNYILSRVFDHAESYDSALAQAQALGFAESDPSFDIEGYDSLFKLVIITVHALGTYVAPEKHFHLRYLDHPRFGHPVRPREERQNQTRGAGRQGERRTLHDVRHAGIRDALEVYLQRRRRVQRRSDPRRVLRPAVHVRQGRREACPRHRRS